MLSTNATNDTLASVLSEAGATTCRNCGESAAVQMPPSWGAAVDAPHRNDAHPNEKECVWVCFECGHEDRRQ